MDQVVESPEVEAARPKSWAADTIMRKYLRIDDPETHKHARETLKAATATFVSRLDHNPEPGIRARLVFGFQESWIGYGLELTDAGIVRKLPVHQIDEAGKPVLGAAEPEPKKADKVKSAITNWKDMEIEQAEPARKPRVNLNPYHCIPLIEELATHLSSAYDHAFKDAAAKTNADPQQTRGYHPTLMTVARNVVGQRVGKQIMDFRKLLDQDALAIMNRAADQKVDLYAILTAADKGCDPIAARNRKQACAAYPLLPGLLMARDTLRSAVDAGAPLKEAIADAYGKTYGEAIPTAVTARLKGLNWQKTSRAGYHDPMALLQCMADTPLDWTPNNRAQWTALQLVWEHASMRLQDNENERIAYRNCRTNVDFMKLMGPDWVKAAERVNQHGGLGGVDDLRRSLWRQCVEPLVIGTAAGTAKRAGFRAEDHDYAFGYDTPPSLAVDAAKKKFDTDFTAALTIAQAFQLSDDWHERMQAVNAAIHKARTGHDIEEVRWGKAFPDWKSPNGLTITMLETETQLIDEGKRLNHCVGGYAPNVIKHGSLILSVRDEHGQSITTMEIVEEDPATNKPHFQLRQHYGNDDRQPPARAEAAAEAWLKAANRGAIAYDRDGMKLGIELAKSAIARNTAAEIELNAGQRQALWDAHRRFMPKPMRDATSPEAWLAASGTTALIEKTVTLAMTKGTDGKVTMHQFAEQVDKVLAAYVNSGGAAQTQTVQQVQSAPTQASQPAQRLWNRVVDVLQRLNPLSQAQATNQSAAREAAR